MLFNAKKINEDLTLNTRLVIYHIEYLYEKLVHRGTNVMLFVQSKNDMNEYYYV